MKDAVRYAWKRSTTPEFDAVWQKVFRVLSDKYDIDLNDEEEDLGGDLSEMTYLAFKAGYEAAKR